MVRAIDGRDRWVSAHARAIVGRMSREQIKSVIGPSCQHMELPMAIAVAALASDQAHELHGDSDMGLVLATSRSLASELFREIVNEAKRATEGEHHGDQG